ncbi:gene transfer agent family protein [Pseudahrensia aquimaris]|uniref:Gene transfer agent family protein n=1 Tax=Pseudahrensia aquimaris TaxID=744461 RepID=A0ABW3FBM3_9HYPH
MVNRHRGEVEAILDGKAYALCLTLGALAELEALFGAKSLSDLVSQLSSQSLTAQQLRSIIGCGLRGAGHTFTDAEVAEMQCEGGAAGYARIAAELLGATFSATAEE